MAGPVGSVDVLRFVTGRTAGANLSRHLGQGTRSTRAISESAGGRPVSHADTTWLLTNRNAARLASLPSTSVAT
ncbi:MAG TPA: hypothetical protein VGR26_06625, partial [Acidimicrobiales bacterium]|nr:hypothetical protein [Acidimicrobiales bacterium]